MKKNKKKLTSALSIILLFIMCNSDTVGNSRVKAVDHAFNDYDGKYIIYISKKDFLLFVYNRNNKIEAEYRIGYGLNPDRRPKLHLGDNRTPEGLYRIIEILSLDANKNTNACKKLKAMNSVYFKAKDGHSMFGKKHVDLGRNAYGSRFFRLDYPNSIDKKRYKKAINNNEIPKVNGKFRSIGSGIAIHGNKDIASIGNHSSSGCIRMHNKDIITLEGYIRLLTPVIISAE